MADKIVFYLVVENKRFYRPVFVTKYPKTIIVF